MWLIAASEEKVRNWNGFLRQTTSSPDATASNSHAAKRTCSYRPQTQLNVFVRYRRRLVHWTGSRVHSAVSALCGAESCACYKIVAEAGGKKCSGGIQAPSERVKTFAQHYGIFLKIKSTQNRYYYLRLAQWATASVRAAHIYCRLHTKHSLILWNAQRSLTRSVQHSHQTFSISTQLYHYNPSF